jgi:hypothetical protein
VIGRMNTRALALLIGIAILTAAQGCGGGSSSTEKTFSVRAGTTVYHGNLSKPRFLAHINAVCRWAWGKIRRSFAEARLVRSPKQSEKAWHEEALRLIVVGGIDFHIFDAIRITGSPPGEEDKVEQILGPMQEAVEWAQRVHHVHSVAELPKRFKVYNARAQHYGLDDCTVTTAHVKV